MQGLEREFENSSGRASTSTDRELPGRFGRYPIHCHPPPSPDPGQEQQNRQEDGLFKIWRETLNVQVVEKSTDY